VLHEATDVRNPLLERLKFMAIVSSNLDEFFMKRIGGLKQQLGAGISKRTVDGRTPKEQIDVCYAEVRDIETVQRGVLGQLLTELREHGVAVLSYAELSQAQVVFFAGLFLREYFSAGNAAIDRPGASVSVYFQFVDEFVGAGR